MKTTVEILAATCLILGLVNISLSLKNNRQDERLSVLEQGRCP